MHAASRPLVVSAHYGYQGSVVDNHVTRLAQGIWRVHCAVKFQSILFLKGIEVWMQGGPDLLLAHDLGFLTLSPKLDPPPHTFLPID